MQQKAHFNKNLSGVKGSLTNSLEPFLGKMNGMDFTTTLQSFETIVTDPSLSISAEARKKYLMNAKNQKGVRALQFYIASIALAGSKLGVI